jgi:hypothetical protein
MPTIVTVLSTPRIGVGDGRAEEYLVAVFLALRVDHLGNLQPFRQKADAAVDLAQPLLAVDVVAVLGAVAVAGRPGHHLDHLWPLLAQQAAQLVLHAAMPVGGHVILDPGRDRRRLDGQLRLVLGFLDEGFAHPITRGRPAPAQPRKNFVLV